MKRALLFVVLSLVLVGNGWAAGFDVTNEAELRNALNTAAGNGEDDTINIAAGTYNTAGTTFSYTPSLVPPEENYSLTIVGDGWENTVLDGGGSDQVMNIDTTGLADDSAAHVTVSGITFQNGNSANSGGGLRVDTNQADIMVENCGFRGNTANFGGGGSGGSPSGNVVFRNNAFSGNTANTDGGGAIAQSSALVTFTNNTFSGNTANGDGGGFLISLSEDSTTGNIYNNIVWDNTAVDEGNDILLNDDGDTNGTGAIVNLYNNDYGPDPNDRVIRDGDHLTEVGNINVDPEFADVSDPDASNWDLHLDGWPCIDMGTAGAPSIHEIDIDGEPRLSGFAPDIGADEVPWIFIESDGGGGGGLCFIATAAYGSASSDEVSVLRRFRDDYLLTNGFGRAFVSAYYKYSPPLAVWIAKHPAMRRIVRIGLYPVLEMSKWLVGKKLLNSAQTWRDGYCS